MTGDPGGPAGIPDCRVPDRVLKTLRTVAGKARCAAATPRAAALPLVGAGPFVLDGVDDLTVSTSRPVADVHVDHADHREL